MTVALLPLLLPSAGCPPDQVTAGQNIICARGGTEMRCWGDGGNGRLGQGDTENILWWDRAGDKRSGLDIGAVPAINFGAGVTVTQVHAGADHTCMTASDDKLRCWGKNAMGELGIGSTADMGDDPGEMQALVAVPVPQSCTIQQVSPQFGHSCLLCNGGTVYCWGQNDEGQLGIGSRTNVGDTGGVGWGSSWVASDLGGPVEALFTGTGAPYHNCAMAAGGTEFVCWGYGGPGNLGVGWSPARGCSTCSYGTGQYAPLRVKGSDWLVPSPDKVIKSGCTMYSATCALFEDDTVECWGGGGPQLGISENTQKYGPTGYAKHKVGSLGGFSTSLGDSKPANLQCGYMHACVVDESGLKMVCWGQNQMGQLGYGDTLNRGGSERPVAGLVDLQGERVTDLAIGHKVTCVTLSQSGVKCWGGSWLTHPGKSPSAVDAFAPLGRCPLTPQPTAPPTQPTAAPAPSPSASPTTTSAVTGPSGFSINEVQVPSDSGPAPAVPLQSFGGGSLAFNHPLIKRAARNGVVYDIYSGSGITSIPADSAFTVRCDSDEECDAFVFIYHAPPVSSSTNGELPAVFVDEDWSPSSCSPVFTLTDSSAANCEYKMLAFRKILSAGTSEQFTTGDKVTKFLTIMLVPKVKCPNGGTEAQCTETHAVSGKTSTCGWHEGACEDRFCIRGPGNGRTPPPTVACPAANTFS